MKKVKRLFKMLSCRTNTDEKDQDFYALCAECEKDNDSAAEIKNASWWKRKQDSIKEIFLMCMTPYM